MTKRIVSVLLLILVVCSAFTAFAMLNAEDTENPLLSIKSAKYDEKSQELTIQIVNKSFDTISDAIAIIDGDENIEFDGIAANPQLGNYISLGEIEAGGEKTVKIKAAASAANPRVDCQIGYIKGVGSVISADEETNPEYITYNDILNTKSATKKAAIIDFLKQTGFSQTTWQSVVMLLIACVLIYLAIVKQFEPLLLLPIAFGMLLTNLMGAGIFHEELFADGHVHWDMFKASNAITPGLVDYLYLGVKLGIYPCLIFVGVGAMTDFGPLIANPKSLLLGAAAQVGIFATYIGAYYLGFTPQEAGSIGIIGGADGPTAIFTTTLLAPHLLGPIAVAAYSYMALVPVIQPPIMKALTTKKERMIVMKELRPVSKIEKIVFPIIVTVFVALLVPSAAALVG